MISTVFELALEAAGSMGAWTSMSAQ